MGIQISSPVLPPGGARVATGAAAEACTAGVPIAKVRFSLQASTCSYFDDLPGGLWTSRQLPAMGDEHDMTCSDEKTFARSRSALGALMEGPHSQSECTACLETIG